MTPSRSTDSSPLEDTLAFSVLESLNEGVLLVDTDQKVLWINSAMCRILQTSPGEIAGSDLRELGTLPRHASKNDSRWIEQVITALQNGKETEGNECRPPGSSCSIQRMPAGTGEDCWLIRFRAVKDEFEDGEQEGVQNYQAIFEYTGTATILVEDDGTIIRVNTEFERLSGYKREEVEGKRSLFEFVADQNDLVQMKWYHRLRRKNPVAAPREYQFRFADRHGTHRLVRATAGIIPNTSQSILSFLDITEQQQVEQALRESEERLNLAIAAADEGLVDWNVATGKIYYSPQCFLILGLEPDAFEPALPVILKLVHPDDRADVEAGLSTLLAGDIDRCEMEFRMRSASGDWVWILGRLKVVTSDADGLPVRIVGTHTDITERKRTEEALRIKDKALESSINGIVMTDLSGTIIYVNQALLVMGGWDDRKELVGRYGREFWHEDHHLTEMLEKIYSAGEWSGELLGMRKDGSLFDVQISINLVSDDIGRPLCVMASCNDISERKRQEQALRDSEERFRLIVETAPSLLIITDAEGYTVYASPNAEKITGYTAEELVEGKARWWVHEEDTPRVREAFEHAFRTGSGCRDFEYRAVRKNGEVWHVSSSWEPFWDADGRFLGFVMQKIDVTERKRAEEDLLIKSKAIEASFTGIVIAEPDGRLRYSNPASLRMWGYGDLDEVAGMPITCFFVDELSVIDKISTVLREGTWSGELVGRRKDGTTFDVELAGQAVTDDAGRIICLMAICTDITERRRAEEDLRVKDMAMRSSLSAIAIADLSGKLTYVNRALLEIGGFSDAGELLGRHIAEFWADSGRVEEVIEALAEGGEWVGELVGRKTDGRVFTAHLSANIVMDEAGNPLCMMATAVDITEQKRTQEALRESEERYRTLAEGICDAIYLLTPEGRVMYVNEAGTRLLRRPRGEIVGKIVHQLFPPDLALQYVRRIRKIVASGRGIVDESRIPQPEGDLWIEARLFPLFSPDGSVGSIIGISRDVTEEKRAEMELRIKDMAMESSLNAITLTDLSGRITYVNRAALDILGLADPGEMIGRRITEIQADPASVPRIMDEVCRTGSWSGERVARKSDGTEVLMQLALTLVTDATGTPLCIMGSGIDITDRKQAEEEIRSRNRHLSILNRIIGLTTAATDPEELLATVLSAILDLLDFRGGGIYLVDHESRRGRLIARAGLPEDFPTEPFIDDIRDPRYADVLVRGKALFFDDYPLLRCAGDGSDAPCPCASIPIMAQDRVVGALNVVCRPGRTFTDETRSILTAIGREVGSSVDRAMLIRQLEAAQREANLYLDILGHDIKNTENVSNLYADLLIEQLEGEEKTYVRKLQSSIRKSIEILRNVSTIRRIHHEARVLAPLDLDTVIRDEINAFRDVRFRYDGTSTRVTADLLLPEIFTNLIGNAIKYGGPDVEITVRVQEHGNEVEVSVEDTGPGIPCEMKEVIFRRFQRGMSRRSGEGLGLYITRLLVEQYGGRIRVDDRVPGHPDEGAAFRFTLRKAE